MYNGQTISLKTILWKVMNNPLCNELNYDQAAEYSLEAIRLLGAPLSFIDKTEIIKVKNYKAALPEDSISIRGIRYIRYKDNVDHDATALRYATDIYHDSLSCNKDNEDIPREFTYTVQNGVINTSMDDVDIQISYKAIPIDDEGYPLIPKVQDVELAIEYYILFRYLEPLWMIGKITDKSFSYIDQKKCWYMGAGQNALQLEGPDHLESIMNSINRLIINDQAHRNFFKLDGEQERIRRYS